MNINGLIKVFVLIHITQLSFAQKIPSSDSLSVVLEQILVKDQKVRFELDSLFKINADTTEISKQVDLMKAISQKHVEIVGNILDTYGWPPKHSLTKRADAALFLTIQHAELPVQKKYLKTIKRAVKKGDISKENYTIFKDRYQFNSNDYQIFGTQITAGEQGNRFYYPILKEKTVNKRRKKGGLDSIEQFSKKFGVNYVKPSKQNRGNMYCLYGFVESIEGLPLANVEIYYNDGRSLYTTNNEGFFKIYFRKKHITKPFFFKKDGFEQVEIKIRNPLHKLHRFGITMSNI